VSVEVTDQHLIERVLGGETEAYGALVRRWERHIYGLTLRMLGRPEDAQDATQETFISAYTNLKNFRGDAKFSSWLYRIALNVCHSRLRRRTRRADASLEQQFEELGFEPAAEDTGVDERLLGEQVSAAVRRALGAIPAEMRQVIIMKEYQDLKFHEIAEILDVPLSTVKTRMYTGLRELRKRLEHLRPAM
jgi:RNA polymerase sigma-70 factor, ECF subfamily